ncbi:class I SAM-dependent DNA methyltransferase [Glutamicibacter halophytocola]|uniref:class I SAM-dependent DNA methyltransferase n=1 Tax=Glutamicibacter halophytocola TaxID=1933880 RepID=UPI0015C55A09|nr:class I SAM-dependent DNA methyltransferase [Glutamicibacter halophytocola]NQD40617.1 class I SAM-dependent DNA methyltransferase [Glutamicibacter halophytocola]
MPTNLLNLIESHAYQRLFLEHLRWSRPDMQSLKVMVDESKTLTAVNVSSYKGLRVWACPELPSSSDQVAVDRAIAKISTDRIVIFHNDEKQVWRWPSRIVKGSSTTTRLTSHVHITGKGNPKLIDRLSRITLGAREDLTATEVIDRVKQAFDVETENESKRASKLMASMYSALSTSSIPEHDISVTLARILFLIFGDDTDMWKADQFQNFIINHTEPDGSNLADRLNELFTYLNTPPTSSRPIPSHLQGFKYVNGGIFAEAIELTSVGSDLRAAILDACGTDWSDISPAIFGSMFQSVRNAETRREFGEHYTSERDILRTLNPLFLDELRQEFFDASTDHKNARKRLRALRQRLSKIQFLDPACGCGNFIIIAYRELRLLEIAIIEKLRELSGGRSVFTEGQTTLLLPGTQPKIRQDNQDSLDDPTPGVTLDNFYGIEIDEWPAKIAETAMFLTEQQCDLQMQKRLAFAPERLPILQQATIVTSTRENPQRGNSLRLDWNELFEPDENSVVAGNPPFLGDNTRGVDQKADLQAAWGDSKDLSRLDYVTAWHAKTMRFLDKSVSVGVWAFVTTNSITQGDQVPRLFGQVFADGWRIKFAHRTFAWSSEAPGAAAVHCVIVGFTKEKKTPARLFTYPTPKAQPVESSVENSNAYLLDAKNVLVEKHSTVLSPELLPTAYGSKPTDDGNLIVEPEDYADVMADPVAAKYVHRYIGAKELLHNVDRWCLWLEDMEPQDLQRSPVLKKRVAAVRDFRQASKAASTRDYPHHHLFRQLAKQDSDYICIPIHVSETRKYYTVARYSEDVIASNANFIIRDPDGLQFAAMSSGMFIAWQKAIGGRLESRLRFASTLTWYTFPFPALNDKQRAEIIVAGQRVLDARALYPERSLAEHYNPLAMAPELVEAHTNLDGVVDRAFGVTSTLSSDEERQRVLFAAYERMKAFSPASTL